MTTTNNTTSGQAATLRRNFSEMDWESFLAFTWLFAVAAQRGKNSIIIRIAGKLLDQLAGRIGAGEAKDFEFDCTGDPTDAIEQALTQLVVVSLHLREQMAAWSFVKGLGEVLQGELFFRRGAKMSIYTESHSWPM